MKRKRENVKVRGHVLANECQGFPVIASGHTNNNFASGSCELRGLISEIAWQETAEMDALSLKRCLVLRWKLSPSALLLIVLRVGLRDLKEWEGC